MYAFEYHRPTSVAAAVADLGKEDAKLLAGGMTLLPTMKQRLAAPSVDRRPARHSPTSRASPATATPS